LAPLGAGRGTTQPSAGQRRPSIGRAKATVRWTAMVLLPAASWTVTRMSCWPSAGRPASEKLRDVEPVGQT
jgi:hypothetical protein